MEQNPKRLHLFQGYGVELEYMIVDRGSLDVRPYSDHVLRDEKGHVREEMDRGETAWSNELVGHVIELKSNGPKSDLAALHRNFVQDIAAVNQLLMARGASLMPTAMHPWMNPLRETTLWAHGYSEIYSLYNSIFDCRGHGWSNLQSVHINLPFYDDEEFGRLHTAVRFLLPILPIISAASPIMEGRDSGFADARLQTYESNQARIPILTGKVIPEAVFSKRGYQRKIYDPIAEAIAPYDPEGILKPVWLNSRGAIARFDRGAIEIRIIDIQECAKADISLVALITSTLKLLVSESLIPFEVQKTFETSALHHIYRQSVKHGGSAFIEDPDYLRAFGLSSPVKGREVWNQLFPRVKEKYPADIEPWTDTISFILEHGNLSDRIKRAISGDFSHPKLFEVYSDLIHSLEEDTLFGK